MKIQDFVKVLNSDFYTGVPDSQLKALCNYLYDVYGTDSKHHIIAANEGNCTAIAAGYHLATGKIPVVYMQNSGEGNVINPVASLLNDKVYAIPEIFVIGWRGEPNVHDEPQHIYQGEITLKLLDIMDINHFVISKDTTVEDIEIKMKEYLEILNKGKSVAFVIKKGALSYDKTPEYKNNNKILREDIINQIVKYSGSDLIVSTTGKASRELFEIRVHNNQPHKYDFLTVGSMGHASSIALGAALNTNKKVWCIDGDGAMLMHMGAMALIGTNKPNNFIHIVINNSAHETVGGMPTSAKNIDILSIAKACGYANCYSADNISDLNKALQCVKELNQLSFIEVKCAIGSRSDLGRPTTTPVENKLAFMDYIIS